MSPGVFRRASHDADARNHAHERGALAVKVGRDDVSRSEESEGGEPSGRFALSSLFDSSFRQLLKASSWTVGASGINSATRLAETILLARYLTRTQFGVFVLIIAFPEAVHQLLDCRVQEAMTRYLGEFLATTRRAQAVALIKLLWLVDVTVSALALGIVVLTADFAAAHLLHDSSFGHLMMIYALGTFLASLDTASPTILRVLDRFPLSFAIASTLALARLGLIVLAISLGAGLGGLIWATVGASVIATFVSAALAIGVLVPIVWDERRTPLSALRGRRREIGKFLLNTNFAGSVRLASSKLDTLIIGLLTGPATVSVYRVAVQLGTAPFTITEPLFVAVYPTFVRLRSLGQSGAVIAIAQKLTLLVGGSAIPIAVVLAYKSGAVVDVTVGHKFHSAAWPFVILLASTVLVSIFFWTRAVILTLGRADVLFKIVAVAAALQIAGLFALVPTLGATGGAVSLAVMNVTTVVLQLAYLARRRGAAVREPVS
jgi:O-antigen/teichoic acid export membrane protein